MVNFDVAQTPRFILLGLGLNVRNFAYPFGDNNAAVQQIVKNCGYNSARRVGDIVSPGTCSGCRYAESIPQANPYAVITPDSIKSNTSLLDMENYVLQAEQHGGGWVPLVIHHVCTGCNTLSITPALLDAFLAWLAPRAADGTIVKTIGDVIGGPCRLCQSEPAQTSFAARPPRVWLYIRTSQLRPSRSPVARG